MNRISRRTILFGLAAAPPLGLAVGCGATRQRRAPRWRWPELRVRYRFRRLPNPPSTTPVFATSHFVPVPGPPRSSRENSPTLGGFNGSILGPTVRAERGESVAFTIDNTLAEPRPSIGTACICRPIRRRPAPDHRSRRTLGTGVDDRPVGVDALVSPTPARIHRTARAARSRRTVPDRRRRHAGVGHPPKTYGVDDVPLIIQDRRFLADGSFDESDPTDIGLLGDTIVTNGISDAYLDVTTGVVRLRILNGSSGRLYNLGGFPPDDRTFDLIATDGGLLESPIAIKRIQLSPPGERAEIVVRVDPPGATTTLVSFPIEDGGGVSSSDAENFGMNDRFDILELRGRCQPRVTVDSPGAVGRTAASGSVEGKRFPNLRSAVVHDQRATNGHEPHRLRGRGRRDRGVDDHQQGQLATQFPCPRRPVPDPRRRRSHSPPPHLRGLKDTVYTPPGSRVRVALQWSEYTDPTFRTCSTATC